MTTSMALRYELPSDCDAIRAVHTAAFPTDAEARLVDALRDAGRLTLSLVAMIGDSVVGHVALSPVTIDGETVGLGLAPVAVRPEQQGRGVGGRLIREALDRCRADGVPLVVVLGEPGYYRRFGFVPASRYGLSDPYGGGDAFLAIRLREDRPIPTGLVAYSPEFALFG